MTDDEDDLDDLQDRLDELRDEIAVGDDVVRPDEDDYDDGPSGPDPRQDPIGAGLATLKELESEYESRRERGPEPVEESEDEPEPEPRSDGQFEEAARNVQAVQQQVTELTEALRDWRGTRTTEPAVEPRSRRREMEAEAEAKKQDPAAARHARTKKRLARLALVLVASTVVSPMVQAASPAQAYAIATESMEPSIPKGSLALAVPGEVEVGDVIVYESVFGTRQVHRVESIKESGGTTFYTTAGDANEAPDSFSVPEKDVIGVVDHHVPYMGHLWLMSLELQAGAFLALLGAYLFLTFHEDRVWFRKTAKRVAPVAFGLVVLIPAGHGLVEPTMPPSSLQADLNRDTPIPLEPGTVGSATIADHNNSATGTAPEPAGGGGTTWKETTLWGCWPFDSTDSGCHLSPTSASYTSVNASRVHVDLAHYDSDPSFHLEAYMKAPSGETTSVRLYNRSDGAAVTTSEVSTTSTSLTRVRSSAFNLTGASEYEFQMKTTNGTSGGEVRQVKLLTEQSSANDTVTRIRVSGGSTRSGGGGWQTLDRSAIWKWDEPYFDSTSRTVRFEVVGKGIGEVALHDLTNNKDRGTLSFNTGGSVVRKRATASLAAGAEHEVRAKTGGSDTLEVYLARVVVEQTGFSSTGRYVDLTWTDQTSSSTFVETGYPGRFHGAGELGNGTGYLEVTAADLGGGTAYIDLFNATGGQAVSGSEVQTSSGQATRLRSGWIDMDGGNASYRARIRTEGGVAATNQAWAIFNQSGGTGNETYDHLLQTVHEGVCTFEFHVESISTANASRMDYAAVTLSNATASEKQVVIDGGTVTKTNGAKLAVAPGETLDHVLVSNPSSAGRTEIEAELIGGCQDQGIHTVQPVTYVFE